MESWFSVPSRCAMNLRDATDHEVFSFVREWRAARPSRWVRMMREAASEMIDRRKPLEHNWPTRRLRKAIVAIAKAGAR